MFFLNYATQKNLLWGMTASFGFLFKQSATWPRKLQRRFYGDRVITIAWSWFSSHPHRTRCWVLG